MAINHKVKRLGIPDKVIEHGSQDQLYTECGYDTPAIEKTVKELIVENEGKKSDNKAFA